MRVINTLMSLAHRRELNKLRDEEGRHIGFTFMNHIREYFEITVNIDTKKLMIVMISPNGDKQSASISVNREHIRSFLGLTSWSNYDPVAHNCTVVSVTINSFLMDIEYKSELKRVTSSWLDSNLSRILWDNSFESPYLPRQPEPIEVRIMDNGRGYYVTDRHERRRTAREQEIFDADSVRRARENSGVELNNYNFLSSETLRQLREYVNSNPHIDTMMVHPQELRENERWYHQHDSRRLRF